MCQTEGTGGTLSLLLLRQDKGIENFMILYFEFSGNVKSISYAY